MGGPPRLIDLSVARTREQCALMRSPVGTDAWMSPEQCCPGDGAPVGPPADVVPGVGATLFRAVTGELPYAKPGEDEDAPLEERYPQLAQRALPLEARIPHDISDSDHGLPRVRTRAAAGAGRAR